MTALLEVDAVARSFGGVQALRRVDFAVREQAILGLVGPNGSGKSTLMNIVNGFDRPTTGRVTFDARDVTAWSADRRARAGVGRVFQRPHLIHSWSAWENVAAGLYLHWRPRRRDRRAAATEILDRLGLADQADTQAGGLPFGRQRMVEIARALAQQPRLLLLDEPATGMTAAERGELSATLERVRGEGVTVIVVEHDTRFIFGLCDRVVVLDAGEVLADGTPDEVARDERVAAAYLGTAGG